MLKDYNYYTKEDMNKEVLSQDEDFVTDAARVIRDEFVALDAENPNFNVVAFVQL